MKKRIIIILLLILFITNIITLCYLQKYKKNSSTTISVLNKEIVDLNNKITTINKNHKEEYELRGFLDNKINYTLYYLTNNYIDDAKKDLSANMIIKSNIVSNPSKGTSFLIPNKNMRLSQRAYKLDKTTNTYWSIYSIFDAGYNDKRYSDEICTLNVNYILEGEYWKIDEIFVDK